MQRDSIFEPLENRTFFSVWTVTSLADDGSSGTLRSMIASAESASGDQTIQFDSSLTAGGPQTISLEGTALEVTATSGTLTIQGPTGSNGITIDAQSESGAIAVDSGATVELDNLTLVNGSDGEGGGIENAGTLNVSNCTITVSSAEWYGGGINNSGTKTGGLKQGSS